MRTLLSRLINIQINSDYIKYTRRGTLSVGKSVPMFCNIFFRKLKAIEG